MTKPPADKPLGKTANTAKEARLAKALRDNLRRRKAVPAPKPKPDR
jgi:hypothetical protein